MSQSCFCLCLRSRVLGEGIIIARTFLHSLYKKLAPLLYSHLFNLYHDADDLKDRVNNDLHHYLPDKSNHLTGHFDYKVEELKRIAAHFIKIFDIKGLKTFLECWMQLLKEHLIKGLEHLKAGKNFRHGWLRKKVVNNLEQFKEKFRCLTDKIDDDAKQKISELHDLGSCKHDSHEHKCSAEESCEQKCSSEEGCEHKGHGLFGLLKSNSDHNGKKFWRK